METAAAYPPTTAQVPTLAAGLQLLPFDSSSVNRRYLLVRHDGRRWHISPYLFQVIDSIDGRRTTAEIADRVAAALERPVTIADIESVLHGFLTGHNIVVTAGTGAAQTGPLSPPQRRSSMGLRIKLIWGRPLNFVTSLLTWLFMEPLSWCLAASAIAYQVVWAYTHKGIMANAMQSSWVSHLGLVFGLVFLSLFFHEFGHAAACRAFGAREGEIGFAIYLIFPVFYCDVTDAWKLTRRQRAVLDLAGLYLQGLFACVMLSLFIATGREPFLWTVIAISASYAPNMNPFLKMDGYWFLSDTLGVANLSQRLGELFRGDRSTMRDLPPRTAALTYAYLAATAAYLLFFVYWLGKYAISLLQGGYAMRLNALISAYYGDSQDLAPALLSILTATLILIVVPILLWRLLRGAIRWAQDLATVARRERPA